MAFPLVYCIHYNIHANTIHCLKTFGMHTSTQWKKTILQYISSISSIIHQVQFSDDTNGSKSYIRTEVLVCYDTTTIIIINLPNEQIT